ncbi:MAG: alpha-amylase family glycosyl hydrolase [Acidobacteriota bacterium]
MLHRPSLALLAGLSLSLLIPACQSTDQAKEGSTSTEAPQVTQWQLDWADGRVFYEVFVRSFADSDGDGVGDLQGLIDRLDYLNDGDPATTDDLGVGGLWLMPIFESPSYHGYDTVDYSTVDREYGTVEDFERLAVEAEKRGMKIVLDFMINHSSREHPWFQASASSPEDPKRDWYLWREEDPGWTQPFGDESGGNVWHELNGAYYYGVFWAGMPDLNFRNPEVVSEIQRLASLWIDRGAAGFRLDAARHLVEDGPGQAQNSTPGTHRVLRELSSHLREGHPGALLLGECWTDLERIAAYYGSDELIRGGDELPMLFNFPLSYALMEAVAEADSGAVRETLAAMDAQFPAGALHAPFLTNHDQNRVATTLHRGDGLDDLRLRLAAALLLTQPGTPFVYYGEEVGLSNGIQEGWDRDPAKRTPMPWSAEAGGGFTTAEEPWHPFSPGKESANVAAQIGDEGSLLSWYRRLIHLRNAHPALGRGEIQLLKAPSSVLAYVLEHEEQRLLVAHYLSVDQNAAVVGLEVSADALPEPLLAINGERAELSTEGRLVVSLGPGASGVWRLRS